MTEFIGPPLERMTTKERYIDSLERVIAAQERLIRVQDETIALQRTLIAKLDRMAKEYDE